MAQRPERQNTRLELEIAGRGLDAIDRGARNETDDPQLQRLLTGPATEPKAVVNIRSV
jgi:hypothetical protein